MHLNDIAALKVGDRIRATDDIDLDHHAYVERGETGTVVAIEVEAGDNAPTVFIRLDKPHWGLRAYDNEIWLFPECDDVSSCVEKMGG
jgi:uncharacterized protein YuzE